MINKERFSDIRSSHELRTLLRFIFFKMESVEKKYEERKKEKDFLIHHPQYKIETGS